MKRKFIIILKIVISIVIMIVVINVFNVKIYNAAKHITNYYSLILALLIPVVINPLISNNRWKIFLEAQGIREKFTKLLKISFMSLFLGLMLPATTGNDAFRMYYIEKRNSNLRGAGSAAVLMERLLGLIILTFLGMVGSIIVNFYETAFIWTSILLAMQIVWITILIALKNKKLYKKISTYLNGINKGKKYVLYLDKIYYALLNFRIKKIIITTIILILIFQLSTIVCAFLIFNAFQVNIPFYYHLFLLPIISIISIIPISLSGFGIREGGFVYFYGLIGVDGGIAITVSLLYYAILTLVPAFIGMIFYLTDNEYKKVKEGIINESKN